MRDVRRVFFCYYGIAALFSGFSLSSTRSVTRWERGAFGLVIHGCEAKRIERGVPAPLFPLWLVRFRLHG